MRGKIQLHNGGVKALIRYLLLKVALVFFSIYLPLVAIAYMPYWGVLHCDLNKQCYTSHYTLHLEGIHELAAFYRHQGELQTGWSEREKSYFQIVRKAFDALSVIALLMLALLLSSFNWQSLKKISKNNLLILPFFILLTPFLADILNFCLQYFFAVEHFWQSSSWDLSYYIMSQAYLQQTFVAVLLAALVINILVWRYAEFKVLRNLEVDAQLAWGGIIKK